MTADVGTRATDLCTFLHAAPTPHHATAEAARRLTDAGFTELTETERWPGGPGARFTRRGGALVAWRQGPTVDPAAGVRLVGAHTDSPNLRLKPHPDDDSGGWRRVAVEPYGGVLWNSWLDRDLGIAGRLFTRSPGGTPSAHLVRVDEPWLRVPQLAIHLDRDVNSAGVRLDPARHLDPVWGLGSPGATDDGIVAAVARAADLDPGSVVGFELMCHDLAAPTVAGAAGEFVSSARIDNLVSCWAAVEALAATDGGALAMICLFDHEEVGSATTAGAASTLVADSLARIAAAAGLDTEDEARLRASSWCVSADGAHATHPTRPEVHDARHRIALDGGVVVKHNANQRYATDAAGVAWLTGVAETAGVPLQHFSMRNDLPCGSTIGPISATRLGIPTIDVGVAQLAMHSARELCGSLDAVRLADLLTAVLAG